MTRWRKNLTGVLKSTDLGILLLTKDSQLQPWICYEAGILSQSLNKPLVITFLIDFSTHELLQPIKQFNSVSANQEETWNIIEKLYALDKNNRLTKDEFKKVYENLWPFLEDKIEQAKKQSINVDLYTENTLEKLICLVESISKLLYEN